MWLMCIPLGIVTEGPPGPHNALFCMVWGWKRVVSVCVFSLGCQVDSVWSNSTTAGKWREENGSHGNCLSLKFSVSLTVSVPVSSDKRFLRSPFNAYCLFMTTLSWSISVLLMCWFFFPGWGCQPDPGWWEEASALCCRLWSDGCGRVPHF